MKAHVCLISFAALLLLACGGEEDDGLVTPPTPTWKNKAPKLIMASPGSLAVGEDLSIFGEDFIDSLHGYPVVILNGNFIDTSASAEKTQSQPVNLQYKATTVNSRKITWKMWPNIVFDKTGDHLGEFVGTLQVVNVGTDASQLASDRMPVKVTVKPSLVVRMARPQNTTCGSVVTKTIEDAGFTFSVTAVGLKAGTESEPLTVYWTFTAEQWQVSWNYGTGTDFSALFPKKGAFVVEQRITSGATSTISDDSNHSYVVKVGSDLLGSARLKVLKTGQVPDGGTSMTANISVLAVDSAKQSTTITLPMDVAQMAQMIYKDSDKIAERYQPVMVTDCMHGGDIGRQVTYAEDKSETRSRGMSFNYNTQLGANFAPIPSNPFALGINFSVGFGVDVNAQVSTTKSKSLNISGQILPGEYGVFYRQTTRVHRIGKIVIRNYCGEEKEAGDATLTDWLFTPDLATGTSCPPKTKLAPAGKFL